MDELVLDLKFTASDYVKEFFSGPFFFFLDICILFNIGYLNPFNVITMEMEVRFLLKIVIGIHKWVTPKFPL